MNLLSKLHAVMLLSLPAPVLCLLDSGRSDIFVCRMYLAGGILIICSLALIKSSSPVIKFCSLLNLSRCTNCHQTQCKNE